MKRKIEIFAEMNAAGYAVGMKVNGRKFSAQNKTGDDLSNVTTAIGAQLEGVYGQYIKKYWEYGDIHDAYCTLLGIASQLHALHRRLEGMKSE